MRRRAFDYVDLRFRQKGGKNFDGEKSADGVWGGVTFLQTDRTYGVGGRGDWKSPHPGSQMYWAIINFQGLNKE
jgi:hypothetical protein